MTQLGSQAIDLVGSNIAQQSISQPTVAAYHHHSTNMGSNEGHRTYKVWVEIDSHSDIQIEGSDILSIINDNLESHTYGISACVPSGRNKYMIHADNRQVALKIIGIGKVQIDVDQTVIFMEPRFLTKQYKLFNIPWKCSDEEVQKIMANWVENPYVFCATYRDYPGICNGMRFLRFKSFRDQENDLPSMIEVSTHGRWQIRKMGERLWYGRCRICGSSDHQMVDCVHKRGYRDSDHDLDLDADDGKSDQNTAQTESKEEKKLTPPEDSESKEESTSGSESDSDSESDSSESDSEDSDQEEDKGQNETGQKSSEIRKKDGEGKVEKENEKEKEKMVDKDRERQIKIAENKEDEKVDSENEVFMVEATNDNENGVNENRDQAAMKMKLRRVSVTKKDTGKVRDETRSETLEPGTNTRRKTRSSVGPHSKANDIQTTSQLGKRKANSPLENKVSKLLASIRDSAVRERRISLSSLD